MAEKSHRGYEVFISYSAKDKRWADAACAVLERHRIRCWVAPRDITPGTEWGAAIIAGIDSCRVMVLIFSAHANESAQVRREVERAISKGLAVLPCRVEDVRPEGAMEYALSNTHWLDAFSPPVERQMELLADSVKTLLGKDRAAGARPAPRPPPAPARPAWRRGWLLGAAAALVLLLGLAGLWAGGAFRGKAKDGVLVVKDKLPPAPANPVPEVDAFQPGTVWKGEGAYGPRNRPDAVPFSSTLTVVKRDGKHFEARAQSSLRGGFLRMRGTIDGRTIKASRKDCRFFKDEKDPVGVEWPFDGVGVIDGKTITLHSQGVEGGIAKSGSVTLKLQE